MQAQQTPAYRPLCQLALAAGVALASPACTLTPNDGDTVSSRTAAVSFDGYHPTAEMDIEVQSFNPATGGFAGIGDATSSSSPTRYDDTDLYAWSTSANIPLSHWQAGRSGFVARLRMRDSDGNSFYTFPPDWGSCLSDNPDIGDFVANCASPHSPDLFLYTPDFPTGTDFVITDIRRNGSGGLAVTARNQGRHGTLQRIECWRFGAGVTFFADELFLPATSKEYDISLSVPAGRDVTCTAIGVNEDGSSETADDNNSLTRTL